MDPVPSDIAFNVRLAEADWDDTMNGWRCPALNVPGAKIEDIYVEGARVDRANYEVLQNHAVVRWVARDRPTRATASVVLTKLLSLGTETDRWKKLAIVLPLIATIIAAVISGGATYLASGKAGRVPVVRPATAADTSKMTVVTFVNETGAPVSMYWASGSGELMKYRDIESGASYKVLTYGGAQWIARNAAGRELLSYTANGNLRTDQVDITN